MTLIDTAGRRAGASDVEGRGIERGGERADDADLELWIAPASDAASVDALPSGDRHWRVWSKVDVAGAPADGHGTSALTGAGIESLRAAIVERACSLGGAESALLVSERQRQLVDRALETIERARDALHRGAAAELIAADLQIAQSTLATLVGEDVSDEVLDELFARFCIGK